MKPRTSRNSVTSDSRLSKLSKRSDYTDENGKSKNNGRYVLIALILAAVGFATVLFVSQSQDIDLIDSEPEEGRDYGGPGAITGGGVLDGLSGPVMNGPNGPYSLAYYRIGSGTNLQLVGWNNRPPYVAPSGVVTITAPAGYTVVEIAGDYRYDNAGFSGAFIGCKSITSVVIPSTVTTIGLKAFEESGIMSITIPDSVTTLGTRAFSDCTNLTSVTISNSVTLIGNDAFSGCTNLKSVTIPRSVTGIGYAAFEGSGLTSITIPSSVDRIHDGAFTRCPYLSSVFFEGTTNPCRGTGVFSDTPATFYSHGVKDPSWWMYNGSVGGHTTTETLSPTGAYYDLSYDINNGSGSLPGTQKIITTTGSYLHSGAGLSRSGYTLTGWNTDYRGAGYGTHYNLSQPYTPSGDSTLYAEWTVNSFSADV